MAQMAARLGRWQPVLFLPLAADSWERGSAGATGLFATLALSVVVIVGLLLVVLVSARRCETNSEAARRAWNGDLDPDSLPRARVVHTHRRQL
jgi:hypothetical protein